MSKSFRSLRARIAGLFSNSEKQVSIQKETPETSETSETSETPKDEKVIFYNDRQWVNDEDSSFTGSIVCHFVMTKYFQALPDMSFKEGFDIDGFVEFSDCQNKLRYHTDFGEDTKEQIIKYKNKIIKLRDYLDAYKEVLDEALDTLALQGQDGQESA